MGIPRFQLFEFADFDWFPNVIRNLMTDNLHHVETKFRLREPITDLLAELNGLAEPFTDYGWRSGTKRVGNAPNNVTYLIGVPKG